MGEQDEVLLERREERREMLARELSPVSNLVEVMPSIEHAHADDKRGQLFGGEFHIPY